MCIAWRRSVQAFRHPATTIRSCVGVSETLVAFIVKAVVLQPANEFQVDRVLASDDVQRLIELCVKRLLDVKAASLDTIKMQVYFDMNYTSRDEFLTEHRRVLGTMPNDARRRVENEHCNSRNSPSAHST